MAYFYIIVAYTHKMATLILARHGESEWNALHKVTGVADVALSSKGIKQAIEMGRKLQKFEVNTAYTSRLQRAIQTFDIMNAQRRTLITSCGQSAALNERDFGNLTGRDKTDLLKELGTRSYSEIFKGWETPAPYGESLETVYKRVAVFYEKYIAKDLKNGNNVLIVSHHHALRTLIKRIERLSINEVSTLHLTNTGLVIYDFENGVLSQKELLT
jgi:2,3-bisphosphoglycerate-dependent phosphoglycerate mutase